MVIVPSLAEITLMPSWVSKPGLPNVTGMVRTGWPFTATVIWKVFGSTAISTASPIW